MMVVGKALSNLKPLHNGKTRGINVGEIFVGVLENDLLRSALIYRGDADDICNASEFYRLDELSRRISAYAIEYKSMRLCKNKI